MNLRVTLVGFCYNGGMYHYTANLAKSLTSKARISVTGWESKEMSQEFRGVIPSLLIRRKKSTWQRRILETLNPFFFQQTAQKICLEFSPDIVHIVWGAIWTLPFAKAVSRYNLPIVLTVHDPYPHEHNRNFLGRVLESWHLRHQMPSILRIVDGIHVHSHSHQADLTRLYGAHLRSKIFVVPHGGGSVPETILRGTQCPEELRQVNPEEEFVILFFGRIHPYKGLDYLLEAVRQIKGFTVRLVIAGDGVITSSNIPQNTILINRFIEDEEINAIFKIAHVVVLPYISATQSGVIPLAYFYGKPVIATNVGALPEAVIHGETGLIVPPRDSSALRYAIETLIKDRDFALCIGVNGNRLFKSSIGWESLAEEFIRMYYHVIGQSKPFAKRGDYLE